MATGPRYKVPMRRRREARTDYHQRLRLLKSGRPRLVARPSNRHIRAQLIVTGPSGDRTLASAFSGELRAFGWEAPTGNLPAAYLTGLLGGRRALGTDVGEAVLDIGLNTATPGSRVFAVQEGAVDAGLDVPHNDDVFADWGRTSGEHIAEYAASLDDPLYAGEFDATDLPEHFEETRDLLMNADADELDANGEADR